MAVGRRIAEKALTELLSFSPADEENGLEIVDHVERRHFAIETPKPVSPRNCSTDVFEYPVDRAVTIEAKRLSVPQLMGVYVRNSLGFLVAELTNEESREFPEDRYHLELPAPIKLYLVFDGAPSIDVSTAGVEIAFDARTEIHVGARSHHKQPAATITITEDPEDLMVAVTHFASGLKTTSCERSYPTLRGHPPTIERGDELHVPDVLDTPDSGVTIEVPPEYESIVVIASLAYYLGAEVVPGDRPRIVTDEGFVHRLDESHRGFEGEVERVLKQVFFLDCITRTEGFYQVDLHERNEIEGSVDLDFAELYDATLSTQLEAYLDVPYYLIEPHLPEWKLTAHFTPEPRYVENLPFVVNDLAVIRTPRVDSASSTGADEMAIEDLVRSTSEGGTVESAPMPDLVRVGETDSMEQTWIGEGAPIGASKGMIEAFRNAVGRVPKARDISITIVCNAPEMDTEEDLVSKVYGSRENIPFDVSVHRELDTRELRDVFKKDTDLLHYIGHIDADGFECNDGHLDATSIELNGIDVFFLNACSSYQQGLELIKSGSVGGVVTLQDVINSGAERVGDTLARLLNRGFPLRVALNIAKQQSIMGGHYLVVGDGNTDIAQAEFETPLLVQVKGELGNNWVRIKSFATKGWGMGSLFRPLIKGNDEHYLCSGGMGPFNISKQDLVEYIKLGDSPVQIDGTLTWRDEFLSSNK